MRDPRGPRMAAVAVLLFSAACTEGSLISSPRAPAVIATTSAPNRNDVLSVIVTAQVQFADSVAARYGPAGTPLDSATPAVTSVDGSAVVPVLGLLPDTPYDLRIVAYGHRQTAVGDAIAFTTGALPADLPRYLASGSDPSPGYVVFAAGKYGIVIDNTGRVVWYRRFLDGLGLNFQAEPTGHYYARPPTPDPTDVDPWVEIDVLGEETRAFGCARNLQPRFHDLIAAPDGSYWIMCDETRTMDLSAIGGVGAAQVMGTVIQHVSGDGVLLMQWSPFDHFAITDLDPADRSGASVNWTHGNALDLDAEGNLLVSFRSLSELTKIDTQTGAVMWRMGGLRNQFAFLDAPTPGFARQHGLRVAAPGRLVLLDNLGDPAASRAEHYVVDETLRTARQVASYGSTPPVIALLGGTTQALPGDRTLVAFGNGGRVEEYDASGRVVWRIEGDPGYVFRAQRIRSLYRPGVGSAR
jgi:arylsulfotransferase ASST